MPKTFLHARISACLRNGFVVKYQEFKTLDFPILTFPEGWSSMNQKPFQDYYPDVLAHCYGCGKLNERGYQIKSYWEGEESVCHFSPSPDHIAIPGYVYGGLLASLIDCHGTRTAAASGYRAEKRAMDTEPAFRFLTASLHVDYLKPTPLGIELIVRGKVKEIKGRKVIIEEWIEANGITTVRGEVIAVQISAGMVEELLQGTPA
jgi:acyl-coenzyme A thioesterase PaaI-like protein